ncbi:Y-family DNA polymerase [Deinococcus sp. SDU3-2]|uniref:Y-family DNA polymerase n=1 Tax=Deinococcus terrestris TaxID=2651870 RepID=A0A7X1NYS1_9DEIO|nr:Y-family DNA polymerase [Deinococcus terrestris]MPY68281.1 Y-family DNA polymerase [Deinococcus terrestris]
MAPGRTPLVACVQLAPWPLVLLARQHPGIPVAVLGEGSRKVVFASAEALEAGVQPGMRETAALSRCPELHAEVVSAPTATAAWAELLEVLYARYSDRVEGREPGLAYLKVSAPAARDLAAALHTPVGLAASLEVAQLAALRASPGEVREVVPGVESAFLKLSRTQHLQGLGLTPGHIERLHFLGVRDLGGLMGWSAAQREAFLGVDVGKRINRFLRGDRTAGVARYVPGKVVEASLRLDSPLHEPGETEVALKDLVPGVLAELRGRTCAYLTVHADTVGGRLSATRKLKWPLDERGLTRVAGLALGETGALSLGIDALTVQLSGLQQPSRMVGLWAGLAELEVTQAVLDRFPEALVRVEWLDPFAYAVDAQYQWVDWVTGAVRTGAMTPRQTWMPPVRKREQAVNQVLAFFEGRDP